MKNIVDSKGRTFRFDPEYSSGKPPREIVASDFDKVVSASKLGDRINFAFEDRSLPYRPELGDASFHIGNASFIRIE